MSRRRREVILIAVGVLSGAAALAATSLELPSYVSLPYAAVAMVCLIWLDHGVREPPARASDLIAAREKRIDELTRSLKESATLASELEADIAAGQGRAAAIRAQIERDTELAALTKEQAAAMQNALSEALGASERRALRQDVLVNLLFFAAGIGVSLMIR